ncbi:MAG: hypothetical protein QMC83_04915 [Thermodesulfovibrionales bacterium]|nr:hypothetical protein [Thermodesulfovibrionales bacterium]
MNKLLKEKEINSLRGLSFVFGVLLYLESDPVCRECSYFDESIDVAKDKFLSIEKLINGKNLSEEMRRILSGIYAVLAGLNIPDNPKDQKKAENCKLPKRVCLPKLALSVYRRINSASV